MDSKITKPTNRKTIEPKVKNIYNEVNTVVKLAWDFPNGDVNEQPVKMLISVLRCYIEPGNQEIDQRLLTVDDVRPFSNEVWNAKCRNCELYGKWLTNWEYEQYNIKLQEQESASELLISMFK
jgi:hypothetical protein